MSFAGMRLAAGRIPTERIETSIANSNSSNFTTSETEVQSVTAAVVSGRTYRVRWVGSFNSDSIGDEVLGRIREDDASGNELTGRHVYTNAGGARREGGHDLEAEYTADATEDKTFSVTGERTSGSGTVNMRAAGNFPAYLYVDYIRG